MGKIADEARTARGSTSTRRARLVAVAVLALPIGVGVVGAAYGGWAQAASVPLVAALDARQEVPKPTGVPAAAKGTFTATLAPSGTVTWKLTFRKLSGRAIAAHVHLAGAGRSGPIALNLCGPCATNARGTSRVSASLRRALQRGGAYVNVHTSRNPAGEIRGQVRVRTGQGQPQPPPKSPPQPTPPPPSDPYPPYP